MRWVLLEEVVEIQKGKSAKTRARVPQAEFSPEVLLLEMMAQTGGLLMGAENDFKDDVIFAKIESASFPLRGNPGDPIEILATADHLRPEGSWIEAVVQHSRGTLAAAKLMLAHAGALVPGKTASTTFHNTFMSHYKVREKIR
jgi:3-hydroxymyristoyl/3-hydroxydecanoyl-(acyl carrier protein) dehydratase